MLVHQRGDEGFLSRYTPEAVKARATAEAQQAQDDAELQRQMREGGGRILAPASTIGGPHHPDLRGMENPMRVAEATGDYEDALRWNRAALGALRELTSALALVPGRKSLVVVSEGIIDDPEVGELAQILDAARAANAVLYFLDVRGLMGSGYTAETDERPSLTVATLLRQGASIGTERLAEETGGRRLASNDLADGLRRVAAEAHSYYLLGYEPPERRWPDERKIAVRVRKPGLTVRTRPAWRAEARITPPAPATPRRRLRRRRTRPPRPLPRPVPGATRWTSSPAPAPTSPTSRSPSRPTCSTRRPRPRSRRGGRRPRPPAREGGDRGRVPDARRAAHGRDGLAARRHGGSRAGAGAPVDGRVGTHAPLAKTFELAPGRYQARLAIEVAGLARRGAATVTFDVPPLAGLRLSSPIVTDRLGDRLDRAPRPVVRGLKAFWPNATLYCQFEVYGATREPGRALVVEAGYTVHAPDGTTARSAGPTRIQPTPDGRVLRLFGFPLGGLAPGVYSLAVDVRDGTSGATTAATDTFRVQAVRR